MNLNWMPPAMAECPYSALTTLRPEEWCMEPKIDGYRAIIVNGEVYTRHGVPMSNPKGADKLKRLIAPYATQTLEGEWVNKTGTLYLFDLPDHPGTCDERRQALLSLPLRGDKVQVITRVCCDFTMRYNEWRGWAEGVVFKRRQSKYQKQRRPGVEIRDWLKRRYSYDSI